MMENSTVAGTFTTNTFVYMHTGARHMLELARATDHGQRYTVIACLIYCAFTLEAYLNHLGQLNNKEWDKVERRHSKLQKYEMLALAANINFNFDIRPYKTLAELFRFRDSMAHGKTTTETIKLKEKQIDAHIVDAHHFSDWQVFATLHQAQLSFSDVEALVKELHAGSGHNDNPFDKSKYGIFGAKIIT